MQESEADDSVQLFDSPWDFPFSAENDLLNHDLKSRPGTHKGIMEGTSLVLLRWKWSVGGNTMTTQLPTFLLFVSGTLSMRVINN